MLPHILLSLSQPFYQQARISNISAQQRVDLSAINAKKKKTTEDPGSTSKCYKFQLSVWEGTKIFVHVCIQIPSPTHAACSGSTVSFVSSPPLLPLISHYSFRSSQRFNAAIQVLCNRSQKTLPGQNQQTLALCSFVLPIFIRCKIQIKIQIIICALNDNMEK